MWEGYVLMHKDWTARNYGVVGHLVEVAFSKQCLQLPSLDPGTLCIKS